MVIIASYWLRTALSPWFLSRCLPCLPPWPACLPHPPVRSHFPDRILLSKAGPLLFVSTVPGRAQRLSRHYHDLNNKLILYLYQNDLWHRLSGVLVCWQTDFVKASIIAAAFDVLHSSVRCEPPVQVFRVWRRLSSLHSVFPTYGFNGGILNRRFFVLPHSNFLWVEIPSFPHLFSCNIYFWCIWIHSINALLFVAQVICMLRGDGSIAVIFQL